MDVRRMLAGVWAILPLAALLVTTVALPPVDPALTARLMATVVLCALAAAALALLQRVVPQAWSRWAVTAAAGVGWGAWLLHLLTARAGDPQGGSQAALLGALVGGVLAGAAGYAVHGRRLPSAEQLRALVPERSRVQPLRGRAAREVQPWSTELDSRTMRVLAWGVLTAFAVSLVVVLVNGEGWVLALVLVLVGVGTWALALAWSAVRLVVDASGLHVRSRVLPVRLARVPAEAVAGVAVQDLDPMRWGGIGLRPLPDRTSFIVDRGGPGIVVYRRDGRRLALQVPEGDSVARDGARRLLQAAGQRLAAGSGSGSGA